MAIPILLTKVTLPHRNRDLLTRQRLVELVEESLDRKLTLIVAPAGYGKTSLIIDVAHRHDFPFCWYSTDLTDAELSSFLEHLIACIEIRFSQFGEQSRAALLALNRELWSMLPRITTPRITKGVRATPEKNPDKVCFMDCPAIHPKPL